MFIPASRKLVRDSTLLTFGPMVAMIDVFLRKCLFSVFCSVPRFASHWKVFVLPKLSKDTACLLESRFKTFLFTFIKFVVSVALERANGNPSIGNYPARMNILRAKQLRLI